MHLPRSVAALALTAGIAAAACTSSGSPPGTATPTPTPTPATAGQSSASPGASSLVIGTASSATLGSYLTGPNGMTLYTYASDTPGTSMCTETCATSWPPLTLAVGGQATAGSGVSGTLGTITRADGTMQVTLDGMPLYYWVGDSKPGDTTGDGVNGFSIAEASGASPAPTATSSFGY